MLHQRPHPPICYNDVMKIIKSIDLSELKDMAEKMFGTLVKADVDIVKKIVIIDMELHADGEADLLDQGSKQSDLWGINLYPEHFGTEKFIEFDSMINMRPSQKNPSRTVLDKAIQAQIISIIGKVVHE